MRSLHQDQGSEPDEGLAWWQRGVIYQIYPRSFSDSSGDGVGDLRGITARLAYLAWLGVDAVWISPIYRSPMADFGYDVTDHTAVAPAFGTLEDLDALIAEAHRLGLRVLLDYVPNHTSIEHRWFVEARASRQSPRRDWYLWRDPAPGGGPPNNWRSVFGGSAWTLDPASGQFYYHAYLPEQPDLNWRHPPVRAAMLDVLRFWLDRGVDGFRVDALRHLLKDPQWRDNPPNPAFRPGMVPYEELAPVYSADRDDVHEPIAALREVLRTHGDPVQERVLIGELCVPIQRLVRYYGRDGSGLQLPSNMHLIATDWRAQEIAALIECYEAALPVGAWPNWVLGNHDRGRPQRRVPGPGVGRDSERTPMQWSADPNAGFCPPGVEPWLPIAENHDRVNLATEREDPHSLLTLHHRLLELRRNSDALTSGAYETVRAGDGVLAYLRQTDHERLLIALNLTSEPRTVALSGRVRLSTRPDREGEPADAELRLRADEGLVLDADGSRWPR